MPERWAFGSLTLIGNACGLREPLVAVWHMTWSRVLGRGCDEAETSEEKRLFTEWGPSIQRMKASVRNSTEKAIL